MKDKEFKQQAVDEFKIIGGNDTGDLIRRIISRLMTKSLQREFIVDGLRGNRKLKHTEVWSTIISAAKNSPDSKGATDKKMEKHIRDYLRHAKDKKSITEDEPTQCI
ncbi:hypothetical protein OUZ56_016928 [Daphnia magna]|uniref:Uncharacterized protein n=1 Tax=Daphnia magna TaxID=35525 RepID=A0ABR0ARN7_9CRUS|nr:hypothetical protein OUZ56_016928 [Daphnia magna]